MDTHGKKGQVPLSLSDIPVVPFESFVSISKVADYLDLHKKTIIRLIEDGELRAARMRNQYRIAPGHLQDYFNRIYA